jgi:predicted CoA-binding protein
MTSIDTLVKDFLAQKHIAVVGVSSSRETGCNAAYQRFVTAGYTVTPVSPHLESFEGVRCYPDLRSIPERPDAVFVLTKPEVTDAIVEECVALGIRHVWMHCLWGTRPGLARSITSVSERAVERCHEHGIAVIPGACPNQYLAPDPAHRILGAIGRGLGWHCVS